MLHSDINWNDFETYLIESLDNLNDKLDTSKLVRAINKVNENERKVLLDAINKINVEKKCEAPPELIFVCILNSLKNMGVKIDTDVFQEAIDKFNSRLPGGNLNVYLTSNIMKIKSTMSDSVKSIVRTVILILIIFIYILFFIGIFNMIRSKSISARLAIVELLGALALAIVVYFIIMYRISKLGESIVEEEAIIKDMVDTLGCSFGAASCYYSSKTQ